MSKVSKSFGIIKRGAWPLFVLSQKNLKSLKQQSDISVPCFSSFLLTQITTTSNKLVSERGDLSQELPWKQAQASLPSNYP